MLPDLVILVLSEERDPDWVSLQVIPAYFANFSLESKLEIVPISDKIPEAKTGPIPGMESKTLYSVELRLLQVLSIAKSTDLTSFSKVLITLKEKVIEILIGS